MYRYEDSYAMCTCVANTAFTNSFYLLYFIDIGECLIGSYNCSQICVELDGGYECNCSSGYELRDDGFTCEGSYIQGSLGCYNNCMHIHADIDECALGISGCNQGCRNTNGSFICTCHEGYQTHHEDPTFCVGM